MASLLLHAATERALEQQAASGAQNIALVGPKGIGKASLARHFVALRHTTTLERLDTFPYVLRVQPATNGNISIEVVRKIEHFLSRRVPAGTRRTIVIEDASQLSLEAQNALLKMLEEPPQNTVFILTVDAEKAVLPTIRSRSASIHVHRPPWQEVQRYFLDAGFDETAIKRAALVSGGLPGLMDALLRNDTDHPLIPAAELARRIIQASSFERLTQVDTLAKDKSLALHTLYILQQMAHVSLSSGNANRIWKPLLEQAYNASRLLEQNGQAKLILTDFMLKLSV